MNSMLAQNLWVKYPLILIWRAGAGYSSCSWQGTGFLHHASQKHAITIISSTIILLLANGKSELVQWWYIFLRSGEKTSMLQTWGGKSLLSTGLLRTVRPFTKQIPIEYQKWTFLASVLYAGCGIPSRYLEYISLFYMAQEVHQVCVMLTKKRKTGGTFVLFCARNMSP